MWEREREWMCVREKEIENGWGRESEKERDVDVWERKRESDRERVCVRERVSSANCLRLSR